METMTLKQIAAEAGIKLCTAKVLMIRGHFPLAPGSVRRQGIESHYSIEFTTPFIALCRCGVSPTEAARLAASGRVAVAGDGVTISPLVS